eukprot:4706302-Amphidinium_carterae.4
MEQAGPEHPRQAITSGRLGAVPAVPMRKRLSPCFGDLALESRPGTAASSGQIQRGLHPQYAQAIQGTFFLVPAPLHLADPEGQDPIAGPPLPERPSWLL